MGRPSWNTAAQARNAAMLIKRTRGWEIPESRATPEAVWLDRRRLLKALAAAPMLAGTAGLAGCMEEAEAEQRLAAAPATAADPSAGLYPPKRSEEHTSELQSLMRTSYAVFCLKK